MEPCFPSCIRFKKKGLLKTHKTLLSPYKWSISHARYINISNIAPKLLGKTSIKNSHKSNGAYYWLRYHNSALVIILFLFFSNFFFVFNKDSTQPKELN